jgi:long-chain acyl-CoA synthetase
MAWTIALILSLTMPLMAAPRAIEGVKIEPQQVVGNHKLVLNGAGLRTATLLNVKIYVVSFYAPKLLKTAEAVYSSPGPLRIDVVYLRAFKRDKVIESWRWQFEQNVSSAYENFDKERDEFLQLFGGVSERGTQTIEIEGNETRVYNDGVFKGKIIGKPFQQAFLTLWFGETPVMPQLKKALLAG